MFFKVFLLTTILAQASSATIAEEDFYKHSDDYEDYEYEDGIEELPIGVKDAATNSKDQTNSKYDGTLGTIRKLVFNKDRDNDTANNTTSNGDFNDDPSFIVTDNPTEINKKRPVSSYEVVEIVDDIPNNVTFRPIVTNFTIPLPLNNATGIVNTSNAANGDKDGIFNFLNGKDKNKNDNDKSNSYLRKNTISIFHVNAEFDDDKESKPVVQNIHIHQIPLSILNVRDHIDKFKDDVFNHVHKHDPEVYNDVNEGYYFPNILAGPKDFLRKLRERGSAIFHRYF